MAAVPTGLTTTGSAGAVQVAHSGATGATGYLYRWRRTDHPTPPPLVTESHSYFGLDRIDQRALPVNQQYQYTWTGAGVRIYFLEIGVRYSHQEFTGRTLPGQVFWPGGSAGVDNGAAHGTRMAGVALGATTGVAKGALAVHLRVREAGMSTPYPYQPFVDAMNWIAANHPAGVPGVAVYATAGWAEGDTGYTAVRAATQACLDAGVHVVHAYGYGSSSTTWPSEAPGNVPGAIGVSQSNTADANHENSDEAADIWAPGADARTADITSDSAYMTFGGSSSASGYVAGALALLLEANPHLSPARGREVLVSQASRVVTGLGTPLRPLLYTRSSTAEWSQGAMGLTATIDGLEPGGTYEVAVASVENGAVSAWSASQAVVASGAASGLHLGDTPVVGAYLGDTPVTKIALGDTQVWGPPTSMGISFVGAGAGAGGTTSVTPLHPENQAGDLLLLYVGTLRYAATSATIAGTVTSWTTVVSNAGGETADLPASSLFSRVSPGGLATNTGPTVAVTGGNSSVGQIVGFRGTALSVAASTSGNDASLGTAVSVTGGSITTQPGDVIVVGVAVDDNATLTGVTLAQAGATLGAASSTTTFSTTSGNDSAMVFAYAPVTSGGSGAPTVTATASLSVAASAIFVVLRES